MIQINEKIKNWIRETLEIDKVDLMHPKDLKNGDYAFFNHSTATENDLAEVLNKNKIPEIDKIEIAGKFINFYLSKEFFADSVKEINKKKEKCGENKLLENQKIIIEYTDPNPFKLFHIGHLMSNTIGESISRIIEWSGAELKKSNYQGDVGIHIAYTLWGMQKKGGIKEGHINDEVRYLGECYALGAQTLKENESLKSEFQEINKKIYDKSDEEINKLYEWGRKVSLDYFETMYARLGTTFDKGFYFFESETGEKGKQIVLEFLEKGIFEESDGAIVFRGEKRDPKLHTRVFVNSQGLPVYEAKELALAKIKYERYPYDKSIVITGNEINEYFKVLLAAMNEVFPDLAQKTQHLSHGMLRLPTGKMSSRTGDVITAEALIDQVKEKVAEKLTDRDYGQSEKEKISEIVAIGAIKYSILRQTIGGDIIFDFEKSISFEGDSGPYLQYTAVRAKSVLQRAAAAGINSSADVPDFPAENTASEFIPTAAAELERYLYRFPEIVERAGSPSVSSGSEKYAPHHIVTYLTELASIFNSFYAKEKIIDEADPNSPYKLALTAATHNVLKSGLHLLGIKVPERM